jgi:hypothetical protein
MSGTAALGAYQKSKFASGFGENLAGQYLKSHVMDSAAVAAVILLAEMYLPLGNLPTVQQDQIIIAATAAGAYLVAPLMPVYIKSLTSLIGVLPSAFLGGRAGSFVSYDAIITGLAAAATSYFLNPDPMQAATVGGIAVVAALIGWQVSAAFQDKKT